MALMRQLAIGLPIVAIMAIFGSHLVAVPTGSMYPSIVKGDIVFAQKTDVLDVYSELNPEDIAVGDIVVFEKEIPQRGKTSKSSKGNESKKESEDSENKEIIIHRVVDIKKSHGEKYLIVKGDNNTVKDDETVSMEQVRGKAIISNGNPVKLPEIGNWIFAIKSSLKSVGL